jgi:preprotein translocase subunit SecA
MYKERDNVIELADPQSIAIRMVEQYATEFVTERSDAQDRSLIPYIKRINKDLLTLFHIEQTLPETKFKHSLLEDVAKEINTIFINELNRKLDVLPLEEKYRVERHILLVCIDRNWTSHIDKMSKLRDGISLRSYAQVNPLQAYIQEGRITFDKMKRKIASDFVATTLRVRIEVNNEPVGSQQ